jgi:hypothetical protein
MEYLRARRSLPLTALHAIGDEKLLFELYLMNGTAAWGHADARRAIETHADLAAEAQARNAEYRYYSGLMIKKGPPVLAQALGVASSAHSQAIRRMSPRRQPQELHHPAGSADGPAVARTRGAGQGRFTP